ncbi:MAG TPA: protein-L-isoaspartate(D-aspartate) O-methyltransferase [Rhizobiaceae bacterium]|nr:protein-L-isoaspartate(D-aspartate) O-methyltransferase [Rhizobiaceae bacterium]
MADERESFAAFLLRLRGKGIVAKNLIAAFEATPRKAFIDPQYQPLAWSERMLPIECGEAIEGADLQALTISALEIEPGHKILEVGAGSGYTAGVMARLAGKVVTIERYKRLAEQARARFDSLGITNVQVKHADGFAGLPAEGPFDRIVVWAAFDSHPRVFVEQLSSGGTMVAPIGPAEDEQVLAKLTKVGSRFERADLARVRLQPLLKGMAAVL